MKKSRIKSKDSISPSELQTTLESPQVKSPSELTETSDKLSSVLGNFPAVEREKILRPLIKDMDKMIKMRISNEMKVLKAIEEGFLIKGTNEFSPTALMMHKSAKDSISELIKIKMKMEGIGEDDKGNDLHVHFTNVLQCVREYERTNG